MSIREALDQSPQLLDSIKRLVAHAKDKSTSDTHKSLIFAAVHDTVMNAAFTVAKIHERPSQYEFVNRAKVQVP